MGHTPSPWQFIRPSFIGTVEEDYQTIAYLSDHRNRRSRSSKEELSNGYLIAAAPDMLAALEEVLWEDSGLACIEIVRDAIRKAKGEA